MVHRTMVLVLVLGTTWRASAQAHEDAAPDPAEAPEMAEAREHFEAGREAFDVGSYERAAVEFRASYALSHHPDLLYNIYSALERAGQRAEAADALERYLASAETDGERRTALRARLARLRERLAEERALEAEENLAAATAQRGAAEPGATTHSGVHPAGVALLIGGGVLLVNFAVFAGLTAAEDSALSSSCGTICSSDQVSGLGALGLVADISWISGALVAATGVVLILALEPGSDEASARVAPWAGPDAGGVTVVGAF